MSSAPEAVIARATDLANALLYSLNYGLEIYVNMVSVIPRIEGRNGKVGRPSYYFFGSGVHNCVTGRYSCVPDDTFASPDGIIAILRTPLIFEHPKCLLGCAATCIPTLIVCMGYVPNVDSKCLILIVSTCSLLAPEHIRDGFLFRSKYVIPPVPKQPRIGILL